MSTTMRAMTIRAPMDFSIEDAPVPKPEPGGFLLKVEAVGLCGSDLRTIRSGHKHVTFPWRLGHEISGTIVELGAGDAGKWKIGDRLSVGPNVYDPTDPYCVEGKHELSEVVREIAQQWPGGFAEYVAIPPEAVTLGNLLYAPEHLAPEYAAIVEPGSSVIHAHERAETGLGDSVLILGSGPIGCLHIAVARARGAKQVIIGDIVQDRLDLASVFEPDVVINSKTNNLAQEVAKATGGAGPDVVITANPAPISQVEAVEVCGKGGRVVLFGGLPHGDSKPGVDMNLVHYKNLVLIGISKFAPRHFRMSLEMLASGQIPGDRLVSHILSLEEFGRGVELAMSGQAMKVVFKP